LSIDPLLFQKGFTLQAALEVPTVAIGLPEVAGDYNQLLVFGQTGSGFWKSIEEPLTGSDPLDRMSIKMVEDFLQRVGCGDYRVLYPSTGLQIDLRALGKQLGWHADSALGIGVNAVHGTWFAYRVVVLANTFYETHAETRTNNLEEAPCVKCVERPCVDACPVGAPGVTFDLQACMNERVREGSACAYQCLARNACPVGAEYRYDQDQMRYHYQKSLELIRSNQLA